MIKNVRDWATKPATQGFTLVEILIVIGILALLATTLMLTLNPAETQKKARDTKRLNDMRNLQLLLEGWINGEPTALCTNTCQSSNIVNSSWLQHDDGTGVNNLVDMGMISKYLQELPLDPNNGSTRTFYTSAGGTVEKTAEYFVVTSGSNYEIAVYQESKSNIGKLGKNPSCDYTLNTKSGEQHIWSDCADVVAGNP